MLGTIWHETGEDLICLQNNSGDTGFGETFGGLDATYFIFGGRKFVIRNR